MQLAQTAGESALNAVTALLNGGTLVFFSGTEPSTPETALSGNTTLATFTFSSTAFSSATVSGGNAQATASFTASTVTPAANGTVTFARAFESNGTTVVGQFTVGTSGDDITVGSTALSTGVQVTITSFVLEIPVS